jgi:hypothetical protein
MILPGMRGLADRYLKILSTPHAPAWLQQGRNDRAWLPRRASSILNKSGLWNPDAIEAQLAHVEGNAVRRAYAREEFWDERVKMMQWWADQLDQLKQCGEVIDALNPT